MIKSTGPVGMGAIHLTALSHLHQIVHAKKINRDRLRSHLVIDHGIHVGEDTTKGEMGRLHTLVHAVLAYPMLGELMELSPGYGTGKHVHSSP